MKTKSRRRKQASAVPVPSAAELTTRRAGLLSILFLRRCCQADLDGFVADMVGGGGKWTPEVVATEIGVLQARGYVEVIYCRDLAVIRLTTVGFQYQQNAMLETGAWSRHPPQADAA